MPRQLGVLMVVGAEGVWEAAVPLPQVCSEPTTTLKQLSQTEKPPERTQRSPPLPSAGRWLREPAPAGPASSLQRHFCGG